MHTLERTSLHTSVSFTQFLMGFDLAVSTLSTRSVCAWFSDIVVPTLFFISMVL